MPRGLPRRNPASSVSRASKLQRGDPWSSTGLMPRAQKRVRQRVVRSGHYLSKFLMSGATGVLTDFPLKRRSTNINELTVLTKHQH